MTRDPTSPPSAVAPPLRVLIVAEHASAVFGGEAVLPLHYFRQLRRLGVEAWLLLHERTRGELLALLPEEADRLFFVRDTALQRALSSAGARLPGQLGGFVIRLPMLISTQLHQRRALRALLPRLRPTVIHQPIPVSPTLPSALFGLGVPVVIGPMNGGMNYPEGFSHLRKGGDGRLLKLARRSAAWMNRLIPGKLRASTLLVANERTRRSLPPGVRGTVLEMVENAVDLDLWRAPDLIRREPNKGRPIRFVFVGRMVALKCIDVLLDAFHGVVAQVGASLLLIGDGPERARLESQVDRLGLRGSVSFAGWLPQAACVSRVQTAQALILPSVHECGGAVVLEAMALGLPVIAADWGGPADYIDPSTGILVSPASPASLRAGLEDAMLRLARDPDLAGRLGEAGRSKVEVSFNWKTKIEQMIGVYRQASKAAAPR